MTTVFLHVGMPKCASTTVQGYFHTHDLRNLRSGFVYPREARSHSDYFSHEPITNLNTKGVEEAVAKIKSEVGDANYAFISTEVFFRLWDKKITGDVIRSLNENFGAENVRLMIFFRNHFSFVESAFAQFLSAGVLKINHDKFFKKTAGDVGGFCDHFRRRRGFEPFNYSQIVQNFKSRCDPKNSIDVYSIEKADLPSGDILRELCLRFSIKPPSNRKRSNARYPPKTLLALSFGIQKHGYATVKSVRFGIVKHFMHSPDGYAPALRIQSDLARRISAQQEIDADFFKKEFGADFRALFTPREDLSVARDPKDDIELTAEDRAWLDKYFDER